MTTELLLTRNCRRLGLALMVLLCSTSVHALSCVAPDEIIQRTLQTAEPPFPNADVVIYGKVIELLPVEFVKAGLERADTGHGRARVRVIEGFRGAAAGQVLVLRTNEHIAGNKLFSLSEHEQFMVVKGGVVAPCLQFRMAPQRVVELRRHFERYPSLPAPSKSSK